MNSFSGSKRAYSLMLQAVSHITSRDRNILRMIRKCRVLTTDQVSDLFFSNVNTAQHRLTILYELQLLQRFRILTDRYDNTRYHYVLDQLGAMFVGAEDDDKKDPDKMRWNTGVALALGRSQRLAHIVGTNGFFVALTHTARRNKNCRLAQWWPEWKCAAEWGEVVRPDGYGVWVEDRVRLPFLLEYDRGTETLERLGEKLKGYDILARAAGYQTVVLFSFPSPQRESHARYLLAHGSVPVATCSRSSGGSPAGAIWRLVGDVGGARLRLIDLAFRTARLPAAGGGGDSATHEKALSNAWYRFVEVPSTDQTAQTGGQL